VKTASLKAQAVLAAWERYRPLFQKVAPHAAPAAPVASAVEAAPAAV
jgi:hypothetical protein